MVAEGRDKRVFMPQPQTSPLFAGCEHLAIAAGARRRKQSLDHTVAGGGKRARIHCRRSSEHAAEHRLSQPAPAPAGTAPANAKPPELRRHDVVHVERLDGDSRGTSRAPEGNEVAALLGARGAKYPAGRGRLQGSGTHTRAGERDHGPRGRRHIRWVPRDLVKHPHRSRDRRRMLSAQGPPQAAPSGHPGRALGRRGSSASREGPGTKGAVRRRDARQPVPV